MRARNIKPGFYRNDDLAECSFAARLLYPGLWMMADRAGRMEYRPKRIKAELFPYDNLDIAELVNELSRFGLVKIYAIEGREYLWIPQFLKHQNPHKNEAASILPPHQDDASTVQVQVEHSTSTVQAPDKHSTTPADSLIPDSLIPESSLREKEQPNGCLSAAEPPDSPESPATLSVPDCDYREIIRLYHEILPELPAVKTCEGTRKDHLRTRWRETHHRLKKMGKPCDTQALLDWWKQFFQAARASDFLMGRVEQRGRVWRAGLDFLVSPKGYTGVLEGKYFDQARVA